MTNGQYPLPDKIIEPNYWMTNGFVNIHNPVLECSNYLSGTIHNSTNDLAQSIQQSYVSRKEFDDLKHLQKSDARTLFVFTLWFCVMFIIIGHALDNRVKKK